MELYKHQRDALNQMKNGCILCGGVGSGKSRTAIAYYFRKNGGYFDSSSADGICYTPMEDPCQDLYIITTARKRDTLEWEGELSPFLISPNNDVNICFNNVVIDSWNNIGKYQDVQNAFFIFDEQRLVGSGAWVKAFLKIARFNEWILLSATPGDKWEDYIPVFIANGFYKNRTQFVREHIVYDHRLKFPKVDRYLNTGRLIRLRRSILVDMDFQRKTVPHEIDIPCEYNVREYKDILKNRWNPWENQPISGGSDLCMALRKVVNTDITRWWNALQIARKHKKVIIFYNFDYELNILKSLDWFGEKEPNYDDNGEPGEIAEWNGHKHQPVPDCEKWVYLVQYAAGCEGWNCIKTDTIIFYSMSYSYRTMEQAKGRIDRLNTPFTDLYFYRLKSSASIDIAIARALKQKRGFNIGRFSRSLD